MTRMFVRQLKSVGFVDRGACEGADIIIAKRADSQADIAAETDALNAGLAEINAAAKAGRMISAANMARIQAAMDALSMLIAAATTTASGDSEDDTEDDMPENEQAGEAAKQDAPEAVNTPVVEDTEKADIAKRLEDAEKRLIAAEEAVKRAEDAAKAATDARLTAEFIAKARTDYAGAPATAEELGVAMKRLSDVATADDVALIDRCLKAFAEMASKANVLTEVGRAAPESTGTSAVERINKRAGELVEKGEFATREQAVSHIVATDRELAAAYRAERN